MTPRQLDWRAVQPKLRKIDELLGRLRQLGEFDEKRLQTDHVDALAVERILTLVVDLAFAVNSHTAAARLGRAPDTYAESFTLAAEIGLITRELGAALAPSAGTRNVLVHGYCTWRSITRRSLPRFRLRCVTMASTSGRRLSGCANTPSVTTSRGGMSYVKCLMNVGEYSPESPSKRWFPRKLRTI
jgi:uncharacterized protein YutE (UPF0331/DUF86 family)